MEALDFETEPLSKWFRRGSEKVGARMAPVSRKLGEARL